MRTYELHATFKQVKRSAGRSSVAAAAYRSGSRLVDERTGELHDYTKKGGVEHSAIFAPANSPSWATDRSQLWNAAEQKENRKNSMTARELEVGFPSEFNASQRREAGDQLAQRLADKFGVAVDIAYHEPSKVEGDHPNYHAHILFTSRAVNKDGWEKNKYRDFNKDKIEIDGEKTTRGQATVKEWRVLVADCFNEISQRENLEVKTEHLSFEERGIDRLPTVKMGVAATQMERKGIATDRGNLNREIHKNNAAHAEIATAKRELNLHVAKMHKAYKQRKLERNARLTPEKIKQIRVKHHNRMVEEYKSYETDWRDRIYGTSKRIVELEEKKRRYDKEPDQDKYRNLLGWITDKKLKQYENDWTEWNKGLKDIDSRIAKEKKIHKETPKGLLSFDDYSKNQFKKDHPEVLKEEARVLATDTPDVVANSGLSAEQQQKVLDRIASNAGKAKKPKIMDMKALHQERDKGKDRRPKRKQDRDIER